jgi:GAF domain
MCHSNSSSSCCECAASSSSSCAVNDEMELSYSFERHVTLQQPHSNSRQDKHHHQEANQEEAEAEEEEVQQYRVFSEVASSLLGAPMARVSLVEQDLTHPRVRVLASHGYTTSSHRQRTPQVPSSFEEHAVRAPSGLLVVNDASVDARFHTLPEVGAEGVRFVASVALVSRSGRRLGAVTVMDVHPRPHGLCEEEITTLQEVASEIVLLMEKRQYLRVIERSSASTSAHKRPTNMLNFLRLLELLVESFSKQVNVYLSMENPIPELLTFCEAEAFGSALAVLKCACDQTLSGYIHLRLSLDGDCLTFECENTAPPPSVGNTGSSPCLPVVANYMSAVGGRCGSRSRCHAAASSQPGKGSVVWFSLPVVAAR